MNNHIPRVSIDHLARYAVATTGASVDLTFAAGAGEHTLKIPFEILADLQAALVHARAALIERRRALGSGEESAGLLAVQSLKASELPGGDLHLHLRTAEKVPFHFHLERKFASALRGALDEWLKKTSHTT